MEHICEYMLLEYIGVMSMCKKAILDQVVEEVNEWLEGLSDSNNMYNHVYGITSREFAHVKVAAIASINDYKVDSDSIPEGTTHVILLGIHHWDSESGEAIVGNGFYGRELSTGKFEYDDIEEILSGGPDLEDATLEETTQWIHDMFDQYQQVVYKDLDYKAMNLI